MSFLKIGVLYCCKVVFWDYKSKERTSCLCYLYSIFILPIRLLLLDKHTVITATAVPTWKNKTFWGSVWSDSGSICSSSKCGLETAERWNCVQRNLFMFILGWLSFKENRFHIIMSGKFCLCAVGTRFKFIYLEIKTFLIFQYFVLWFRVALPPHKIFIAPSTFSPLYSLVRFYVLKNYLL